MAKHSLRIVSLLPSTTEIVCALGKELELVGRSHECDFPSSVMELPTCTEPKFMPDGSSYQIDERLKALLQEGLSIYRVEAEQLAELKPDLIVTQDHCEACAASLPEVEKAVREFVDDKVQILSVSPTDLSGVFQSIRSISQSLYVPQKGDELIRSMQKQFDEIEQKAVNATPKTVCCLEWMDPLMTAGNWVPELVDIAGGTAMGAEAGEHSPWLSFEQLLEHDPSYICIMPCGYPIEKTLSEIDTLTDLSEWNQLRAVRNNKVYILDGNQYFNRPGPRLTDSTRILAEILHPDLFDAKLKGKGWTPLEKQPTS